MLYTNMKTVSRQICVFCLISGLLIASISCKPVAQGAGELDKATPKPAADPLQRVSRLLQKPSSQVLNTGFDEIVVESNLQVHRGASKSKSKITLPTTAPSSAAANSSSGGSNKSVRSLEV